MQPEEYPDSILRLVAALTAHLIMQPQIDATIDCIMFCITHPDNFRTSAVPIFLSLLHLCVNVANEVIMMSSILYNKELVELAFQFADIYLVTKIPNLYFHALDDEYKKEMTHKLKVKKNIWTPCKPQKTGGLRRMEKDKHKHYRGYKCLYLSLIHI